MARIQHDRARDMLVTDYGRVRLPLSALNFWRTVSKTRSGAADTKYDDGQAWKNYLSRNVVHMDRQYLAGVEVAEFTALEWGAKTPYAKPKRGPEVKATDPGAVRVA